MARLLVRTLWVGAVTLLGVPHASAAALSVPASDTVDAPAGMLRGVASNGVTAFLGVPYARPPVGALRWSPPEALPRWQGVREATHDGADCPQPERMGSPVSSTNENCLFLNVVVPRVPASDRPLPVMVWIHGGAFVGGAGSLYPLEALARTGPMIMVSVNYRLGALGFMNHRAFPAVQGDGYGIEDQRLALRWVQHNIGAFGGDPHRVTLAGESAGAGSVCAQVMRPIENAGLFQRAIIQSAACTGPMPDLAAARKLADAFTRAAGCGTTHDVMRCLRDKPVPDLLRAQVTVQGARIAAFQPLVIGGRGQRAVAAAVRKGDFMHVPMLLGGMDDELQLYVDYGIRAGADITPSTYPALLKTVYGRHAPEVAREYPLRAYPSAEDALAHALTDFQPVYNIGQCLFLAQGAGFARVVPVYQFDFADAGAPPVGTDPTVSRGAVHGAELPYLFPGVDYTHARTGTVPQGDSAQLAVWMREYWASFVRDGRPVAKGAPVWPRFDAASSVMRLDPHAMGTMDAASAHRCAFWRRLYPDLLVY